MEGLLLFAGFIVFLFVIDLFFLPKIKSTDQDKRREAYQKRIKEEHLKRAKKKLEDERSASELQLPEDPGPEQ